MHKLTAALKASLGTTEPGDLRLRLTRYPRGPIKKARGGEGVDCAWEDWCRYRAREARQPMTGDGPLSDLKVQQPYEVGAVLDAGWRRDANVKSITWFFFDVDSGGVGFDKLHAALTEAGVAHLITQSSTHGLDKDTGEPDAAAVRWHCFVPLDAPIDLSEGGWRAFKAERWKPEYAHVRGVFQQLAGVTTADKSTDDLAQAVFVPHRPPRGDDRALVWAKGRGLCWSALLNATGYAAPAKRAGQSGRDSRTDGLGAALLKAAREVAQRGVNIWGQVQEPAPTADGKLFVVCPWASEHSSGAGLYGQASTETALFVLDGLETQPPGFRCMHAHCAERTAKDFLRWARANGAEGPKEPERPDWGPLLPIASLLEKIRGDGLIGGMHEEVPPTVWPDVRKDARPLVRGWKPGALTVPLRTVDAHGAYSLHAEYSSEVGGVPLAGVIASADAVALLAGRGVADETGRSIARAILCRDPADALAIIALRRVAAERREADGWKDPIEVEATPVFCGDPGFLALTLDARTTYMSTLVLVGFGADAFETLAQGCDLMTMGSPARMWIDRGRDAAIDALRALRPVGRRVTGSARGKTIGRCYPLTPTGAAQRFREAYGDGVRYVTDRKDWRVWHRLGEVGGVWVDDKRKEVEGMAEALVTHKIAIEEVKRATDPEIAAKIAAWARKLDSRKTRLAILADAAARDPGGEWCISVGEGEFDAPERTAALLNTPTGTLDLDARRIIPAEPEHLLTKVTGVPYEGERDPTEWRRLLHDWLRKSQGGEPDLDLIRYVQALCGYFLLGKSDIQGFWIFTGDGRNGKSTFMNIIRRIMGDYADAVDPSLMLNAKDGGTPTHMAKVAKLKGLRLAVFNEPAKASLINDGVFKQISSQDPIQAKWMNGNPFTFLPTHTCVMPMNGEPRIIDDSDGFWRRIVVIRWVHQIPDAQVDRGLEDRIVATEGPAILHWMLDGYAMYRQGGLDKEREPECVKARRDDLRTRSDEAGRFIKDAFERVQMTDGIPAGPGGLPGGCVPRALLAVMLEEWCKGEGLDYSHMKPRIMAWLKSKGFDAKAVNVMRKATNCWLGLQPRGDTDIFAHALNRWMAQRE